ncbi:MAG TPA: squalene/phytoene synthase family protein [Solirubrobacteraceae bacterium]|nr:squalene/phytoene synthase family protein [Solirubrobacteraceae bacterium]
MSSGTASSAAIASPGRIAEAYRHCEALTRAEAANFYYGIRLLPHERRRAICAVYAFARRVDDIGDGELPREAKQQLLDAETRALAGVEDAGVAGDDLVMIALADAYRKFPVPRGALGELIEGVRMDVAGVRYEVFDELVLYCRRVAGAIGRVCLAIFGLLEGADRAIAERLADELGVAMQLTNILRDVREDAENGRVYLPAEDLRRFGMLPRGYTLKGAPSPSLREDTLSGARRQAAEHDVAAILVALAAPPSGGRGGARAGTEDAVAQSAGQAGLAALVRFEAARARVWFKRGNALTRLLDRRSAASVLAMAGIYERLLDRIEAHPEQAVRGRVSLSAREKALVAAQSMLRGAW